MELEFLKIRRIPDTTEYYMVYGQGVDINERPVYKVVVVKQSGSSFGIGGTTIYKNDAYELCSYEEFLRAYDTADKQLHAVVGHALHGQLHRLGDMSSLQLEDGAIFEMAAEG